MATRADSPHHTINDNNKVHHLTIATDPPHHTIYKTNRLASDMIENNMIIVIRFSPGTIVPLALALPGFGAWRLLSSLAGLAIGLTSCLFMGG